MIAPAVAAVVTPVLNGARWIEETMKSVLNQTAVRSHRVTLRYIVLDGGSTDGTVEIARAVGGSAVRVISEADGGMYAALAKGFREVAVGSTVCSYLNAGDLWQEGALDVVLDTFDSSEVDWVCGYHVAYNKAGQIIHVRLPYRYRNRLVATGAYGTSLPSIQQESTFWRGSMLESVDLDRMASFRYAGDYYLWHCFSGRATLRTVAAVLGGFRLHGGHLSSARVAYAAEVNSITQSPNLGDRLTAHLDRVIWQAPDSVKKALGRRQILRYDVESDRWVEGTAHRLPTHHGRGSNGG